MSDARQLMIDFMQMKAFVDDPLILSSGDGVRLKDVNGTSYLDGLSGVFTSNLGHANSEIIEPVVDQLRRLAFGAPTLATTTTALELTERLLELLPGQFTTAKLFSGGSEATEAAIKLARQFHRQSGSPGRYKVISHYRGYHGGTGNALAASGWPNWKLPYEPSAPGFVHLTTPDVDLPPFDVGSRAEAVQVYLDLVESTILGEGPTSIAAIITEPILMSAGIVDPGDDYLRGLRAICDRHGILLIYDEIITGFGRTGAWFGASHSGAWPDLMCVGKGLTGGYSPLSAVLIVDSVARAFWGEPEANIQFHAGHTYGGNPVACAAAIAALEYIRRHAVIDNVVERGAQLADALEETARRRQVARLARGRGLMQGIVFTDVARAPSDRLGGFGGMVAAEARRRGVLLRASPWFVAVAPPLVISAADLDIIVDVLDASIAVASAAIDLSA